MQPASPLVRVLIWLLSIATVLALGLFRSLTDAEYAFSSAVLIPIILVTWLGGRRDGFALTGIAMVTWIAADLVSGRQFSAAWIPYVNALTRLVTYSFVAITVANLHRLLLQQHELAAHDALTGLLNRRAFLDFGQAEVDRARRYGHSLAVVFVDIDNFKQINDSHGHAVGDTVLQRVAQALRATSRASDRIARIGGDEFALLLPEIRQAPATEIGGKLAMALRDAMGDHPLSSASIGVAWFSTADRDFPSMVDAADALMYEIKDTSKNAVRFLRIVEDGSANARVARARRHTANQNA